jgi:hypothetical protein
VIARDNAGKPAHRAALHGSGALTLALALTMTFVASTGVSTHRRDEYLQAARIGVEPEGVRIDLDLTPGIDVADVIIALIDDDQDASLSRDEQRAYASEIVGALEINLDGAPLNLSLTSSTFPELSAFRRGEGTIRLQLSATHPSLPAGAHQLLFRNRHLGGQSVYLANALMPDNVRVSVTEQRRDPDQTELTIGYAIARGSASLVGWLVISLPVAAVLIVRFTRRNWLLSGR